MPLLQAGASATVRARSTRRFDRDLAAAPPAIQRAFEKQLVWQARVNDDWRFYFTIEGDVYTLRTIRSHPK